MSISTQCPSCSVRVTAPDRLAGRPVKCPKCQSVINLPHGAGFEVVDDDEPIVARPKVQPPDVDSGFSVVDDEEPDRPRPPKKVRKRVVEDDEDEELRSRRPSSGGSAAGNARMFILIGGVLAFLLVATGGVYYALTQFGTKPTTAATSAEPTPGPGPAPPAPVEWKTFTAPDGSFTVRVPGTPVAQNTGLDFGGVKTLSWELTAGTWEYKFTVVTLPAELPGEGIVDTMTDTLTGGANKDAGVNQTDAKLGKYPARHIQYAKGTETLYLRSTAIGNRVYVFLVTSKGPSAATADEVKTYFDSVVIK